MAQCSKCGKMNYEGVKYCTACGTPLPVSAPQYEEDDNNQNEQEENESAQPSPAAAPAAEINGEKKKFDSKFLFIIGGVLALGLIIFLIKFFFLSGSKTAVKFKWSPEEIYTNTEVTFTDMTKDATSWDWNFGDGTNEMPIEKEVKHTFDEEGKYWVKLTINGKYHDSMQITVMKKVIVDTSKKDIKIMIEGPKNVKVVQAVTYKDKTDKATKWVWKMGESGNADGKDQTITYTFKSPGVHNISVSNDVATNNGSYKVFVQPNIPEGTKVPAASPDEMKNKLQELANSSSLGKSYDAFVSKYLCDNQTVPVTINGKASGNFYDICQDFILGGGAKILNVTAQREAKTNCVIGLDITKK